MRRSLPLAVALAVASAGCRPGVAQDLARDPSPAHLLLFLLVAPILWIAQLLLKELVGAAIVAVLPPWLKTRRALWTAVALATIATFAAVFYWNTPPRR